MVYIMKVDYKQGCSGYFAFSTIDKMCEAAENTKKHNHIEKVELFKLTVDLNEPSDFLPVSEQLENTIN